MQMQRVFWMRMIDLGGALDDSGGRRVCSPVLGGGWISWVAAEELELCRRSLLI